MKKISTQILFTVITCALLLIFAGTAAADKSSVKINAPDNAAIGSDITIEIQVSHHGNNFFHFTDWVYVKINGEEIKRWEFGHFDTPEAENFTRTITYKVTGPIEIKAEADCNIHGGTGIATKIVEVK